MQKIVMKRQFWDIKSLYKEAKTPAQRALVGYMIETGKANDDLMGASFSVLRSVEKCKRKLYYLVPEVGHQDERQIISIVETTMMGGLRKYALSKREIRRILKRMV